MGETEESEVKLLKPKRGTKIPNFWSISRYNVWRGCAYQYMLQNIMKFYGPKSRAMERGIHIHKLFEHLLLGKVTGLPDELKKLAPEIRQIKKFGGNPEKDWTLTKDCKQTYPTDWDHAWLRSKLDAHHYFEDEQELIIVDLKTGQVNIAQAQMDLYAAMSQFYYPDAKKIRVELWFCDHGEVEGDDYSPADVKRLWKKWVKRATDMLQDREWLPNPGPACRKYGGCPMRSDKKLENGEPGPCNEWKKV